MTGPDEIFDTHFHYSGEMSPAEFRRNIVAESCVPPQSESGIPRRISMIAVGSDYIESCRAREFARAVGSAWFAAGVHPHEAAGELAEPHDFGEFAAHPKLVAVGELGVDYFYEESPRDAQRKIFEEFLALALKWRRPAIVHIRDRDGCDDAYRDAYQLLAPFAAAGGRFVAHCFAGTPEWAERFLALGGFCGVTGMVTFRRADNIREVARLIPDDRLLVETDAPYLAPVPHRGEENHPGFLMLTVARLAAERGVPAADLARLTTANAYRFFGIERREEEAER